MFVLRKMKERLKNIKDTLESWDIETLASIRFILFIVVVIDVVGIYWYLQLKKFAVALLIVSMAMLAVILYLMNKKMDDKGGDKPMGKKDDRIRQLERENRELRNKKGKKKEEKEEEEDSSSGGLFDFDGYNDRLERALGTGY